MSCGVAQGDWLIVRLGNHLPGRRINDDSADRRFARIGGGLCEIHRPPHHFDVQFSGHARPIAFRRRDARRTRMRIVGGKFKGRTIRTPEGRETRPTSDRARESIFNILAHAEWAPTLEDARVIDAFAGSGALGLEAMSRGASFCLFVETDAAARGCIRDNVEALQLFGNTRIHRRSATDLGAKPAGLGEPFDLVFMDPPYGQGLVPLALEQLINGQWLTGDALVVAELGSHEPKLEAPGWRILDERIYGAARVSFLRASG